jgi:hypothetical protein
VWGWHSSALAPWSSTRDGDSAGWFIHHRPVIITAGHRHDAIASAQIKVKALPGSRLTVICDLPSSCSRAAIDEAAFILESSSSLLENKRPAYYYIS